MPPRPRHLAPLVLLAAAYAFGACTTPSDEPPEASGLPVVAGTVEWVDDAADNPGFSAFRDSLRAIVARRDTATLVAIVAPGARLSFGDDLGGPEGFRRMWFTGQPPGGRPVWAVLGPLLDAGSVDEDGAVTVPAVAALWPDSLDAYEHVAVPGTGTARRSADDSTAVARLSRVYLPVVGARDASGWTVRLPDGTEAFVAEGEALSAVGYRATFWDEGGGWRMHTFLAGD
jgi:hypothetical protein